MIKEGIFPTAATFTTLLGNLDPNNDMSFALQILKQISEFKLKPGRESSDLAHAQM